MSRFADPRRRLRSLPSPSLLPEDEDKSTSNNGTFTFLARKGGKKGKHIFSTSFAWGKTIFLAVGTTLLLQSFRAVSKVAHLKIATSTSGITQEYDAVIVGAGWAGIRAAEILIKGGVENILVLEAHNYIGGRSKSINLDNSINNPSMHSNFTNIPFDMGAEWLYADTEMEDALINGGFMKGVQTRKPDAYFIPIVDSAFYLQTDVEEVTDGGTNKNDAATVKTERMRDVNAKESERRVWGGFKKYRKTLLAKRGKDRSYWSAVEKYKERLTDEIDIQFLDMVLAAAGQVDLADDITKLSLVEHKINEHKPDPAYYTSVPGVGYGNAAAKYAAPLVAHKVQLNSKVTEIDYSNPSSALVSFTTNDEEESRVHAKTVLVTASLGVLKAGNIKFTPRLPHWKQEAIDGMGFGTMNKCVLIWNDPSAAIWPDAKEWIELLPPKDENSGKWTTFWNPTKYKGIPILVGFVGGENARSMETQTDEEILDDVMINLKAMFPTITLPDRHLVSRWGSDESVLGTYSYKIVGRNASKDQKQLRKAVENIWFAGEATSSWYGTTIGAWDTGEMAAKGMLKVLSTGTTSVN